MSLHQKENSSAVEDEQRDNNDGDGDCEIEGLKENYQVVSFLAKGSYGRVFKVQENTTEEFFALKLIRKPEPVEKENDDGIGSYSLLHVETEKRILEDIGYYPFLLTLHDSFETCNHIGLLTNYVEGITLVQHLYVDNKPKLLSEDHAAFYIAELSLALHYLHKKGIIHCDLKVDNIMIDLDGHVKLIDYGSAIDGLSFQQKTSRIDDICSFLAVAPEVYARLPYNYQCDWWSLGIILCWMITGKHPFLSLSRQKICEEDDDFEFTDDDIIFMAEANLNMDFQIEKSSISEEAYFLLEKLLHWCPDDRIGIHDDETRMEIAEYSFLKDIDWAKLERREVDAPFKPLVKNADQSEDPAAEA